MSLDEIIFESKLNKLEGKIIPCCNSNVFFEVEDSSSIFKYVYEKDEH